MDLDALEHNVRLTLDRLPEGALTLRPATKSLRHQALIRRILELGGDRFRGLMCFSVEEALALWQRGFDDLLIAYPTTQAEPLARAAAAVGEGALLRFVVDCEAHLRALAVAAAAGPGTELRAVIELDVSYRRLAGRLHAGVRRSPIRTAPDAVSLAAAAGPGVRIDGLLAYEAHIAGLPDVHPGGRTLSAAVSALKALAVPDTRRLRAETIRALEQAGHDLTLINGGGSGSLTTTPLDPSVTEVTAGSGFVMPHLFDRLAALAGHQPAIFFALEVCRASDVGMVTAQGGGYVASGEAGSDKLPLPHAPPGLELLSMEGAGEVQTPLRVPPGVRLEVGDPVLLRHAKAGELAERFASYLLVRGGEVVEEAPTYRGEGLTFF